MIRSVRLRWYPLLLLPIIVLFVGAAAGQLPPLAVLVGSFLFFFWLSSLGFALYHRLRKPKDLRP